MPKVARVRAKERGRLLARVQVNTRSIRWTVSLRLHFFLPLSLYAARIGLLTMGEPRRLGRAILRWRGPVDTAAQRTTLTPPSPLFLSTLLQPTVLWSGRLRRTGP